MSNYTTADIQIGDIITYSTWGSEIRRAVVESVHEDIKNGQSGFDCHLVDQDNEPVWLNGQRLTFWGYCDQIISVEKVKNA